MSDSEPEIDANGKRKRDKDRTPEKRKRMRGESSVKLNHRSQQYRKEWEQDPSLKGWICRVEGNTSRASCRLCNSTFVSELTVIKNHAKGDKHKKLVRGIGIGQSSILNYASQGTSKADPLKRQIQEAEIRTCAFLAEKNISLRAVDTLVKLDKKRFPDSKIAQGMELKRTKATGVVKHVIGKVHSEELVEILKTRKFSIIIDESTDIGTVKTMAVCVRFYDSKTVVTKFWRLVQIYCSQDYAAANVGGTAERLFNLMVQSFEEAGVPLCTNLIGFASDGCNVMFGKNNSVAQRLKDMFPGITVQKCICHSLHLCANEACKELPKHAEDLGRNVYDFFKRSNGRQAQLRQFQDFFEIDPHKILRPSQTRWLSLLAVVLRILEQWDALKSFFTDKALTLRLKSVDDALQHLNDPSVKLYYLFLKWVLPKFVKLNEEFQSDASKITVIFSRMSATLTDLLQSYMDRSYLNKIKLSEVQPNDVSKFQPIQNIYLGIDVMRMIQSDIIQSRHDKQDLLLHFRMRCRNFLIKGSQQLMERFDFTDGSPFARMACLHPVAATSNAARPTSLVDLIDSVPRIVPPTESAQIQLIDDQWRNLLNLSYDETIKTSPEGFWNYLQKYTDLDGQNPFKDVAEFALAVLSLPHTSAGCERVFSKVNLVKTDNRNRLHTSTLNGLLLTSQCAADGGGSAAFPVTESMLSRMNADNIYQKETVVANPISARDLLQQGNECNSDEEDVSFE